MATPTAGHGTVKPSSSTGGRSHRINGYIQEYYLDVVDPAGKMHQNITKQAAIAMAGDVGLDLVEINAANQTRPRSLCKIIDYGKYLFEQKKAGKGRAKPLEQKEIIMRPNIDDNDLFNVKAVKIAEFAAEGHEVKVICKFKGREVYLGMQRGADLLQRIVDRLQCKVKHPVTIAPESKCAWMIVAPSHGQ